MGYLVGEKLTLYFRLSVLLEWQNETVYDNNRRNCYGHFADILVVESGLGSI